jgi:arylsulfatase A-like enzyme
MNAILVILDSLRKDHVGAYGNDWIRTPNLDALAKESLLFSRAYPESAPTILARRAIHTGMRVFPFRDRQRFKVKNIGLWGWQPIPAHQSTLAEILKENGYQTILVTDTLHQYKPSMNFQRGFNVFKFIRGQTTDPYRPLGMAQPEMLQKALLKDTSAGELEGSNMYFQQYFANTSGREAEEDWFAPQVFRGASELLETAKEGQPFFLVADAYDTHPPWDPPEEYVSLYDEGYEGQEPFAPISGPSGYLTERQLQRMRALYAAEITMTDRWLGRFLDRMESLKLFENTLLLVISDHGVGLGEHGITGKLPNSLWPEVTDIMFFAKHPEGAGAGKSSDYFASTHDVAPTILGYLGIESPEPMDGEDLSMILHGEEPEERSHFTLGYHNYVFARDESYAMISRNDGANSKLYDLREDPKMHNDIAGSNPDVLNRMYRDYVLKDAGRPLPKY